MQLQHFKQSFLCLSERGAQLIVDAAQLVEVRAPQLYGGSLMDTPYFLRTDVHLLPRCAVVLFSEC
jgi:hypothetical protein